MISTCEKSHFLSNYTQKMGPGFSTFNKLTSNTPVFNNINPYGYW